jgi:hypothetical protein
VLEDGSRCDVGIPQDRVCEDCPVARWDGLDQLRFELVAQCPCILVLLEFALVSRPLLVPFGVLGGVGWDGWFCGERVLFTVSGYPRVASLPLA